MAQPRYYSNNLLLSGARDQVSMPWRVRIPYFRTLSRTQTQQSTRRKFAEHHLLPPGYEAEEALWDGGGSGGTSKLAKPLESDNWL